MDTPTIELSSCGVTRTIKGTYNTDAIASTIRAFAEFIVEQGRTDKRQFSISITAIPDIPMPDSKSFNEEAWRRGLRYSEVVEVVDFIVTNFGDKRYEIRYDMQATKRIGKKQK